MYYFCNWCCLIILKTLKVAVALESQKVPVVNRRFYKRIIGKTSGAKIQNKIKAGKYSSVVTEQSVNKLLKSFEMC